MTIDKIKTELAIISPWPWKISDYGHLYHPGIHGSPMHGDHAGPVPCSREDTVFIAHAPARIAKLIAVAEAAQALIHYPDAMTCRINLEASLAALEDDDG